MLGYYAIRRAPMHSLASEIRGLRKLERSTNKKDNMMAFVKRERSRAVLQIHDKALHGNYSTKFFVSDHEYEKELIISAIQADIQQFGFECHLVDSHLHIKW